MKQFFQIFVLFLFTLHTIFAAPSLPLPNPDIPADISPPLKDGRVSVHGWLWLPWDRSDSVPDHVPLLGWFYHHTPEFFTDSPHNFELMLAASLTLKDTSVVSTLPIPPQTDLVGTEYVFTPPEFSQDKLITSLLYTYPSPPDRSL